MSTMRCCSAWKVPIGTPNCLRVFRYSSVVSQANFIAPTASAQISAVREVHHFLDDRERAAFGAQQFAWRDFEERDVARALLVQGEVGFHFRPMSCVDQEQDKPLSVFAETTSVSAAGAPSTTTFSPVISQPAPAFFACASTLARL